jgi:hypothetical protein
LLGVMELEGLARALRALHVPHVLHVLHETTGR